MKHLFGSGLKLVAVLVTVGSAMTSAQAGAQSKPVLLELFTSEGCSSCPPADRLMQEFDREQPVAGAQVIVLSEHVDYWNRLGWKDPFSSHQFSQRQEAYAEANHASEVYTPQVWVNGTLQAVGGNRGAIEDFVKEQLAHEQTSVGVTAAVEGSTVLVTVQTLGHGISRNEEVGVYLAIAQNQVTSQVKRGENSGRTLSHVAVVKELRKLGTVHTEEQFSKQLKLDIPPGEHTLRLVAFIQAESSRRILGSGLTTAQF